MSFIESLETVFQNSSHQENAVAMAKYMRNHFIFFGIKTDDRRQLLNTIWIENQDEVIKNAREVAIKLYSKPQRELHYCAIEILTKQLKGNYKKKDIHLIEKLICKNSWWDSVDSIAKNILGQYLFEFQSETETVIERFSNLDNMWLNRSALLFQLGYKQKTNFELLKSECEKHKDSNEFFIQKAIGWALREYGKSNPKTVKNYVAATHLKPLSTKEALKNLL